MGGGGFGRFQGLGGFASGGLQLGKRFLGGGDPVPQRGRVGIELAHGLAIGRVPHPHAAVEIRAHHAGMPLALCPATFLPFARMPRAPWGLRRSEEGDAACPRPPRGGKVSV